MSKTTFILGAGASLDYGYPLGSTLIEEIQNRLKVDNSSHAQAFLSDLVSHQPYSINSFLKDKPHYYEFAKKTIAEILMAKESIEPYK